MLDVGEIRQIGQDLKNGASRAVTFHPSFYKGGGRMEIAYIVCMALVAIVAIIVSRNAKK